MKNSNSQPSRAQRIIALVLTLMFVPAIFAGGIYGMIHGWSDIAESIRFYKAKTYLTDPDDVSFFPMTSARISSLQTALGDSIPLKENLGYINAEFQNALGKDLIMAGSEQLLQLDDGQIYALSTRETLAAEAQEVVAFYEQVKDRVPFLFAYIHPQFYEGSMTLPEGYEALDTGDALADEVLSIVREAGIEALDSREFFSESGYTDADLQLKTDMHWTTLAGILTAQIYAEEIERMTGVELDVSKIQLDQFETEKHEKLFLGEYGQQIGARLSGLDDITLYWPKYETQFVRHTVKRDHTEQDASGSFQEAIIKWDALDSEPDGSNIRGYTAYGLIERLEEITNLGECADMTVLMFRDSYTAPVGSFLSLLVKNVVMVDMRTSEMTAQEYVDQYDPDIVIFTHSRQMYEDHGYDLGTGYREFAAALKQGA